MLFATYLFIYLFREGEGERQRQRQRQREHPKQLHTVSLESNVVFDHMNSEIMT